SNFFDHYIEVARQLALDPPKDIRDVLLKKKNGKPIPKVFMGHSTGAQLFLHALEDNLSLQKLQKSFCGAILNSTYLSPSTWPIPTTLFFRYCRSNDKHLPSETWLSKWVLNSEDFDLDHHADQKYVLPTFGQMRELGLTGQDLINNVQNGSTNLDKLPFPVLSLVGENDWISCPRTNRDIAQKCGFAFANSAKAGHDPVYENEKMRKLCKNAVLEMAKGTFPEFSKRRKLFSYELNTGMIDSFTSFFQKKFRSGIRDPKVGG
ncbi:MAG: alpha/beta hydrolase, partial [Alphaproteobacteria bacterium]|nr:alpha/beta hydrolase [Alphaproteobacteria bacterium]